MDAIDVGLGVFALLVTGSVVAAFKVGKQREHQLDLDDLRVLGGAQGQDMADGATACLRGVARLANPYSGADVREDYSAWELQLPPDRAREMNRHLAWDQGWDMASQGHVRRRS